MRNNDDHNQDALDANLAKLIRQDTRPPAPSENQKQAMLDGLRQKQQELTETPARSRARRPIVFHPLFLGGLAAAALIAFGVTFLLPFGGNTDAAKVADDPAPAHQSPDQNPEPRLGPEIDPPVPVPPTPGPGIQAITYEVKDAAKRIALRDGSTAIAKKGTRFTETGLRQLELHGGSLYLLVAKDDTPLEVQTERGKARALGTRFLITSDPDYTRVAVAQGNVQLVRNDLDPLELRRGEEGILGPNDFVLQPAPRVSHLLGWARNVLRQPDPIAADDKPAGLIAVDPQGQEARLSLRNYTLDVLIEDGVARTTIDQTFFNHYHSNTEGTFYFPLPPGATVSRMAMYVFGKRNEAGMVERKRGQQIYNDIKYENRDPALLEQLEGNLYKLRIFPLEGRQEKRIFISFTQTLDELYHTLRYWFPMDHTHDTTGELRIKIRVKNGAGQFDYKSNSHHFTRHEDKDDLVLSYDANDVTPNQDVLVHLTPKVKKAHPDTAVLKRNGTAYLQTRVRPQLKGKIDPKPRQWFVLNDISASRTDAELRAQIHILKRLLAEGDDQDQFALANLSVDLNRLTKALVPLRGKEAKEAVTAAGQARRLGGTNLERGLTDVLKWVKESGATNPHVIYLGDALPSDGETTQRALRALLDPTVPFIGLAVGKKADLSLLQAAANATGGAAFLMNPKEDLNWRVFDMLASFNTPRLTNLDWEFVGAEGNITAYSNRSTLSAGEVFTLVASTEKDLPKQVTLRGNLQGQPWQQTIDLDQRRDDAGYLPRFFAQKHIDALLQHGEVHRDEVVKLSMQHYVATPFTSLIVLENDEMYKTYNVEKGRKDHWAAYPAPDEIPVVREPLRWAPRQWNFTNQDHEISIDPKTPEEILKTILPRSARAQITPYLLDLEKDSQVFLNGVDITLWDENSIPFLGGIPAVGRLFDTTSPIDKFVMSSWHTNAPLDMRLYRNSAFFLRPDINGDILTGTVTPGQLEHWAFIRPGLSGGSRWTLDLTGRAPGVLRGDVFNPIHAGFIPRIADSDGDGLTELNYFLSMPGPAAGGEGLGPILQAPLISNLTTRIPGLQTTARDASSLVEMKHGREKRGAIAADAANLLKAAEAKRKAVRLDGTIVTPDGRMKSSRTTPFFLKEEIISDGQNWFHLYPGLGLTTRRPVTPTNRAAIQGLVAHWPPSVNELEAHWKVTLRERKETSFKVLLVNPDQADHRLLLTIGNDGRLISSEHVEDGELIVGFSYHYEGDTVTIQSHTGQVQSYEAVEIEVADALFAVELEDVVLDLPLRRAAFYTKQLATLPKEQVEKRKNLLRHRMVARLLDPRVHISQSKAQASQDWSLLIQLNAGSSPLFDHRTLAAAMEISVIANQDGNRFLSHLKALSKFMKNSVPSRPDVEEFLKDWPDSPFVLTLARACLDPRVWVQLLDHEKYRAVAVRGIAHGNNIDSWSELPSVRLRVKDILIASAKEGKPIQLDKMIARLLGREKEAAAKFWPDVSTAYRTLGKNVNRLDEKVATTLLDFALLDENPALAKRCTTRLQAGAQNDRRAEVFVVLARLFARHQQKEEAVSYYEIAIDLLPKGDANLLQEAAEVAKDIDDLQAIDWQHGALKLLGEENLAAHVQHLASSYLDLLSRALKANDIERALTLALEAYDFLPDHHNFLTRVVTYYHEQGDDTERWRWLSTILDRHPKDAMAFGAVADWFSSHEMLDQADSYLAKAHSFDSAHPQWMKKRIEVLYRAGKWQEADALFQELRKTKWADQLQRQVPKRFRIPLSRPGRIGKVSTGKAGNGWNSVGFDDKDWMERTVHFASSEEDNKLLGETVHARQVFTLKQLPRSLEMSAGVHGVECDVYINGKLLRRLEQKGLAPNTGDKGYSLRLPKEIMDSLKIGENVLSFRAKKIGKSPRVRVDLVQIFAPVD